MNFARALQKWQTGADISLRALARRLGCSPSYLVKLYRGGGEPSAEFMASAIAKAPEPWDSVLRQARQADQDAADAAALEVA